MATSGGYSWRAGRRVPVGRGEVQVVGVDALLKVKGRVVLLQGLHVARVAERPLPPHRQDLLTKSSRVLIAGM